MVMKIESLSDNSLILVEEIENGLHPVATARMVEYLIDVAQRKSAQAMFTTHSNDALAPLPPEGIWAAVGGPVYQGKLDIAALRAIAGQIDAQLAIFCEDTFASAWMRAILRIRADVAIEGVEIHEMLGDGTAVKINKNHNEDPSAKFPSVCYIDGDSKQSESKDDRVVRLPGESPEAYVFDRVLEKHTSVGGVLAVRLLQPFGSADKVLKILNDIRLTNHDPHVIFSQVGLKLGLIPESTVRGAFLATWSEAYPDECATMTGPIEKHLPKIPASSWWSCVETNREVDGGLISAFYSPHPQIADQKNNWGAPFLALFAKWDYQLPTSDFIAPTVCNLGRVSTAFCRRLWRLVEPPAKQAALLQA
jgi:hypothetical protein